MQIVTDIKQMGYLLNFDVIAVDIESQTTPPEGHPAAGLKDGFGLSYCADILAIALSVGPEHPTAVILDVDKMTAAEKDSLRQFLVSVLCRRVTIVGHNVVFDLRSIGGHFDFTLPLETRVWDTMPMTRRLLLIDTESSKEFKFGLLPIARKWNLVSADEEKFLDFMKAQRGSLSEFLEQAINRSDDDFDLEEDPAGPISVVEDDAPPSEADIETFVAESAAIKGTRGRKKNETEKLKDLPANHAVWKFCGGFDHRNLEKKSRILLEKYVAYDAHLALMIYRRQIEFANKVATVGKNQGVSPMWNVHVGYWPQLPTLIDSWTEQLRVTSNLAILGLPVDLEYLTKRKDETRKKALDLAPKVVLEFDPTDPHPYFKEVFSQLIWYESILSLIREGTTYSLPKGWVNWEKLSLDPQILMEAMYFEGQVTEKILTNPKPTKDAWWRARNPYDNATEAIHEGMSIRELEDQFEIYEQEMADWKPIYEHRVVEVDQEALKQKWADWLLGLAPDVTRGQLLKQVPDGRTAPKLDLQRWVQEQCFADEPNPLIAKYKAFLKTRWLRTYYRSRKVEEPIKLASANHFKPYFLFCVAGWPLYTSAQLTYELSLATKKFQQERDYREKNGIPFDLQTLAIEMDAFSCGKKSLDWIFSQIEDKEGNLLEGLLPELANAAPKLHMYMDLISTWATHKRMIEYWYHAQRDGKIHTLLVPNTTTGRDNSTLPNLQNIRMKDFKGIFVGPKGFTLMELDLSNAEINMGAMRSGDSAFALAASSSDYHWEMAKVYWPDECARVEATQDLAMFKILRNAAKPATFALPYGAGAKKLAFLLRADLSKAGEIAARITNAFPLVANKKKELADGCLARKKAGFLPAYTSLWTGERVMVDSYQGRLQEYTIWNYQQQGGVAGIIHIAMVLIARMLIERGYMTHMLLNVHDSIILAVHNDEYFKTNVVQEVLQILCNIVPEPMLNATNPRVAFVSETCPSNKYKWGARSDGSYPFPMDEFINQWGRFKLPDEELAKGEKDRKAPTWKGPVHEGWTLEKEMEDRKSAKALMDQHEAAAKAVVTVVQKQDMPLIKETLQWPQELQDLLKDVPLKAQYAYRDTTGIERITPVMTFEEALQFTEAQSHRGISEPLREVLDPVKKLHAWMVAKQEQLANILKDHDQ